MKFETGEKIETMGTHLQGYINISYKEIVAELGEPIGGDEYKVDAIWAMEFEDGTIATIYNWKDGKNYLRSQGARVEDIRDWHIGGHTKDALARVERIFGNENMSVFRL